MLHGLTQNLENRSKKEMAAILNRSFHYIHEII